MRRIAHLENHQPLLGLIFLALLLTLWPHYWRMWSVSVITVTKVRKPWIFKPKTDKDCPFCQAQVAGGSTPETVCAQHVIPWRMRKGPGGRKKTICADGYFCSNPNCYYYLMEDEAIHALVGY
jgi:hypothetical protein